MNPPEPKGRTRRPGAETARPPRGFTLLEMLVVLVIGSVLLAMGSLSFSRYVSRSSAERAAQTFARDLTLARSSARRARAPVVVRFSESSRWYSLNYKDSGTEILRRRFGVNADIALSEIDLAAAGDSLLFTARGVADLSNVSGTLGEARFYAGVARYRVFFNAMGASRIEES